MKKTRLEKFLINRGLLEKFKNNLDKPRSSHRSIDSLCCLEDIDEQIFNAFTWSNTDEGHTYWENVHRQWITSIKKNTL